MGKRRGYLLSASPILKYQSPPLLAGFLFAGINMCGIRRQKKSPRLAGAFFGQSCQAVSVTYSHACNAADFSSADTEIAEFTIRHATQFVYCLSVLAPVVECACDVHDLFPFLSRLPLGCGLEFDDQYLRDPGPSKNSRCGMSPVRSAHALLCP